MQLVAFLLNCGLFAPILLFVLHVKLPLAGLPFALSQVFPGVILCILIFWGKFDLKPTLSMLKGGWSSETWTALKLAGPFVLNVIAGSFPPMLLMNMMMKAATKEGVQGPVAAVFSVFLKIQTLVNSFSMGINQGFIAAGSYAYGAMRNTRLIRLFLWALGASFLILTLFTPFMIIKPQWISAIWIREDDEMAFAKKMLPIPFYVDLLNAVNDCVTSFLLTMKFAWTAMAPSLLRGVAYCVGAVGLYYTNGEDPVRMMWSFCINDVVVLLVDVAIFVFPMHRLVGMMRIVPKNVEAVE
jgi:Na+-driven multidrug efflux pump